MTTRQQARQLAQSLMYQHGLTAWTFTFDNHRTRCGHCDYTNLTISLSWPYVEVNEIEEVRDTITHEIAHALVGVQHGHDRIWQRQHRALGGSGRLSANEDQVVVPLGRYQGTCPTNPKHVYQRHRRTEGMIKRYLFCTKCERPGDNESGRLVWTERGLR